MLGIRRPTIIAWLKHETYEEGRGWKIGKRAHTDEEETRIVALKKYRTEHSMHGNADFIQMDYAKKFPDDPLPSLWFFNEVFRKNGLQTHTPKKRKKGHNIVARQLFPIKTIIGLGLIQQSVDFIGKKNITGHAKPISFFASAYYQSVNLYQVWRILAETSDAAIEKLEIQWRTDPVPHVLREDNAMQWRGTGKYPGHIGKFLVFLLNRTIVPLFSAAYRSYTNPHVEGYNRSFGANLWKKFWFSSTDEIDSKCEQFNAETRELYEWKFKERIATFSGRVLKPEDEGPSFSLGSARGKKICFIRFVELWKEQNDTAGIVVLDRFVEIPILYVNQYVFCALNLDDSRLIVLSEQTGTATQIYREKFEYSL